MTMFENTELHYTQLIFWIVLQNIEVKCLGNLKFRRIYSPSSFPLNNSTVYDVCFHILLGRPHLMFPDLQVFSFLRDEI